MLQNILIVQLQDNGITFKAPCHEMPTIKAAVCFICGNCYLTGEMTLKRCQALRGSMPDKAALSLRITSLAAAGRAPPKVLSTN